MQRDITTLKEHTFDLLVIGGGIYGACVAWDAALRGLSVALVDKGDFGGETSANSLKIIHGGLRYIQDANPWLVTLMSQERSTWLKIAPHLVHPLPCVLPTDQSLSRNRFTMATALSVNDFLSMNRNAELDEHRQLPRGRILSREECLSRIPALAHVPMTGAILWRDAQMVNSERLLLSFVLGANERGAVLANYVAITRLLTEGNRVIGAAARDLLTGETFPITARLVINCTGVWTDELLATLPHIQPHPRFHRSVACNLVTRQLWDDVAAGVPGHFAGTDTEGYPLKRGRTLFITPWQRCSIIGTFHAHFAGPPENYRPEPELIQSWLDEINHAIPTAHLTLADVYHIQRGYLPAAPQEGRADTVQLVRESQLHDHAQEEGLAGLLTIVGVKYTTARYTAEKAVDLAYQKLNYPFVAGRTSHNPLWGGDMESFARFMIETVADRPARLRREQMIHLVHSYGTTYKTILAYLDEEPRWQQPVTVRSDVMAAEIIHAVRCEMAQTLLDVLLRRTELGVAGLPDEAALWRCAHLMAGELGWDDQQCQEEVVAAYLYYCHLNPLLDPTALPEPPIDKVNHEIYA